MAELLPAWDDIKDDAEWTGLLVGNGASVAIWPEFRYSSLYSVASSEAVLNPLTHEDVRLFGAFDTENFEQVLAALKVAGVVANALDLDADVLEERYASIQHSLFQVVHGVHAPWEEVANPTIPKLFDALREYRFVYSTNYDLLLYWASMHKGGAELLDYFWGPDSTFDVFDTEIWETRQRWTRILFLHGGIHLRRIRGGGTRKVVVAKRR